LEEVSDSHLSITSSTQLILNASHKKLSIELWEYERYTGPHWGLPSLITLDSIECHVGRQVIELCGVKLWATVPLQHVSPQRMKQPRSDFFL
jgi:hypothetical protein